MTHKQREIHRKKRVIEYADKIGNVRKACRYFGRTRSTFYFWRGRYREYDDEGLVNRGDVVVSDEDCRSLTQVVPL
jgi:transposase-like protein